MKFLYAHTIIRNENQSGLINRIYQNEEFSDAGRAFIVTHGLQLIRAVLCGFVGSAPASTTQNLIELLSLMVTKFSNECKQWMPEVLFSVCENNFFSLLLSHNSPLVFENFRLSSHLPRRTIRLRTSSLSLYFREYSV